MFSYSSVRNKNIFLEKNPTIKTRSDADVLMLMREHAWLLDLTFL